MEKYETYSLEESVCQRIDLHKNFRKQSRGARRSQSDLLPDHGKDLGAVEYDADAALYPGAVFEEKPEGVPEEPGVPGACGTDRHGRYG